MRIIIQIANLLLSKGLLRNRKVLVQLLIGCLYGQEFVIFQLVIVCMFCCIHKNARVCLLTACLLQVKRRISQENMSGDQASETKSGGSAPASSKLREQYVQQLKEVQTELTNALKEEFQRRWFCVHLYFCI